MKESRFGYTLSEIVVELKSIKYDSSGLVTPSARSSDSSLLPFIGRIAPSFSINIAETQTSCWVHWKNIALWSFGSRFLLWERQTRFHTSKYINRQPLNPAKGVCAWSDHIKDNSSHWHQLAKEVKDTDAIQVVQIVWSLSFWLTATTCIDFDLIIWNFGHLPLQQHI